MLAEIVSTSGSDVLIFAFPAPFFLATDLTALRILRGRVAFPPISFFLLFSSSSSSSPPMDGRLERKKKKKENKERKERRKGRESNLERKFREREGRGRLSYVNGKMAGQIA